MKATFDRRRGLRLWSNQEKHRQPRDQSGNGDNADQHGSQIPPYRETQDYVRRINALGGTRIPGSRTYKWVEITIDGREVVHYSDKPPASHSEEVAR